MNTAPSSNSPSRSRAPRWPWIAAVLLLAVIGFFGYRALTPASKAPEATFVLLSGERVSTSQLQGKVYLVNFWATSCVTCVKEMPDMVRTYDKYKDKGLEFVAVAMQYDPPMYVVNFTETRKLPFKVALDSDGSAARAFGEVQLTPTTFVVDKEGRILKRYIGEPEWDALHKLLEDALARTA
ncbi:TlpA disulfide reductase family protein [Paracidovorax citrulli]